MVKRDLWEERSIGLTERLAGLQKQPPRPPPTPEVCKHSGWGLGSRKESLHEGSVVAREVLWKCRSCCCLGSKIPPCPQGP